MESFEELIKSCEFAKRQILLLSKKDEGNYDKDLFPRLLEEFLGNVMLCMKLTPSIPSGNRFSNWWRLLWDRCSIHPIIHNLANTDLLPLVYHNIKQETITWKLKYLALTVIHFTKIDISNTSDYLGWLIRYMRGASELPLQLTYYQIILELFDVHRGKYYQTLLNKLRIKLVDILDVDIIDPILHLTDMDQFSRTIINRINRQAKPLIIFSIQCAQGNLMYRKLLAPLNNGQLWIDFNLDAKTITVICKRSCLRTERPSSDSEEFDDCTTDILTIEFVNVVKITVKNWAQNYNVQGKLLSFTLNKCPSCMYDSSRNAVKQGTKLFLNIEQGDDLNRLLVILPRTFTTRFEMPRNKPERKVSQPNTSQSGQSNLSLAHYSGRPVSVSSAMSLNNSNLKENASPQVSVEHKEMLSLTRSGSTIKSICQVQTTIQYVNTDNVSASNGGNLLNQNLKKHHLSLSTKNVVEEDCVIESSQENKPTTISSLQDKINRTMDKFNPEPYIPHASNTTLDRMFKQRFDSETGPIQVNDRLKDIVVESECDNEPVISISDSSETSSIISGNLLNRSRIASRSLLKSSAMKPDSENSGKNSTTRVTANRTTNSEQRVTKRNKPFQNWFSQNISQHLDKSLYSPSIGCSQNSNANDSAEAILDRALGVTDVGRTSPNYCVPETPTANSQISCNTDNANINTNNDADETTNMAVQPTTVRRKRGRPRKTSVLNTEYASDGANTSAASLNSTIKSKRRPRKPKNNCDCDPADEVNYTTELPAVQTKDEEEERERLLRSTRTRYTKPPVRYTDELNQSYLQSVNGKIRSKRESGYLTDTVVYQKRASRRPRRTDTSLQRLSQTLDVVPTDYRYGTDLESVRATQSDGEVGRKHRKNKKKSKRVRTEYESLLITMDDSIKLRLSRRNSSCESLTQDSVSQRAALQNTESQEDQAWGGIFSNKNTLRKTNTATLNGAGEIDGSKRNKFSVFEDAVAFNRKWTTALRQKPICESEDEKRSLQLLFNEADAFMSPQEIRATIKENYPEFLPAE